MIYTLWEFESPDVDLLLNGDLAASGLTHPAAAEALKERPVAQQ